MKKKLFFTMLMLVACVSVNAQMRKVVEQAELKCAVQKTLVKDSAALNETYGKKYVDCALSGKIVKGMPIDLVVKAFNTVKKPGGRIYNVFSDEDVKSKSNVPQYIININYLNVVSSISKITIDSRMKVGKGTKVMGF